MEYHIALAESPEALINAVEVMMECNWKPEGGITSTSIEVVVNFDVVGNPVHQEMHTFYQAMTRTRKPNKVKKGVVDLHPMLVVNIYNDIFKNRNATLKRATTQALLTRISTLTAEHFNTINQWTVFFNSLILSEFLMGKIPPSQGYKQFKISLEWIIKPANLAKIIDGKFHEE